MRIVLGLACVVIGLAAVAAPARAQELGVSIETCDRLARERPEELRSWLCYWLYARRYQDWDGAGRRLEAHLAASPENHRARLYLGLVLSDRDDARAEETFLEAAAGLEAQGEHTGAVYARQSLFILYRARQLRDEAAEQLRLAARSAEAAGDSQLLARVRLSQGWQAQGAGALDEALGHFDAAWRAREEGWPPDLEPMILSGLGSVRWALGQYSDSMRCYRREAELHRERQDAFAEAAARANVVLLAPMLEGAEKLEEAEIRRMLQELVALAERAGNQGAELTGRLFLAQDWSRPPEETLREAERALALARRLGRVDRTCTALRLLARHLVTSEPGRVEEGLSLLDESMELARSRADRAQVARGHVLRATLLRNLGREAASRDELRRALETIEALRDLQRDDLVRARFLAPWAFAYERLSWQLARSAMDTGSSADLEEAFAVAERRRARVLLDILEAAGATRAGRPEDPLHVERDALLERVAEVQARLGERALDEGARAGLTRELEELEREERELRGRIAGQDPLFASVRYPELATLASVQAALAPHEALLAYQVADRDMTGLGAPPPEPLSWLIAVTRDGAAVFGLPGRGALEESVRLYLGLLERRDGLSAAGSAALYRDLLGEAMRSLPEQVRSLVIVPDGILHRLPFGALRATPSRAPLAWDFEVALAPSATTWLRWRAGEVAESGAPLLALADPELGTGEVAPVARLRSRYGLGPLPHARREARDLARALGGDSVVRTGAEASESFLKGSEIGRYGILHLAAHAVVDETGPERSAVLLAPGSLEEDGLLHLSEIAELDLRGCAVLLTACRSASGALLEGEGVVGLAHGFFQAGSRAVLGGLWSLRDDETADLVSEMARHLARGASLGEALAAARRQRIEAGAPAASWAGLVLVGDGSFVPAPSAPRGRPTLPFSLLGLAALALALLLLLRRRRAR